MAVPGLVLDCVWLGTAVLVDEVREVRGRVGRLLKVDGPAAPVSSCSPSFLDKGVAVSLRMESAEGARPAPEVILLVASKAA